MLFYTDIVFVIIKSILSLLGLYLKNFSVSDNFSDGFLHATTTIPEDSSSANSEILISTATAIPISLLLVLAIFVTGIVLMIRKWKNNVNISSRYSSFNSSVYYSIIFKTFWHFSNQTILSLDVKPLLIKDVHQIALEKQH